MKITVSERITNSLINSGAITNENKELYTYGIQQGFFMILNTITTIIIGLIFGMVWESIIFMLAYLPLRSYAGGYHAKTKVRCYLFSIVIIIAALLGMKFIPWTGFICLSITFCAGEMILFIAPVEDRNKPLDQEEKAVYKKRTCIILSVLVGVALLLWFLGQTQIPIGITLGLAILSVMLILGKIKNLIGG